MAYELQIHNNHLIFTINRPEKHNAINDEVMVGLQKALDVIKENKQIGCFIITGAGEKSFCSGGDLSVFHALRTEEQAYAMLSKMGKILYEVATLPIPTIALMNGTAVGGGCEIAIACDYRIVHKNAKAGFIQGKLAITTGWGGGTYLMQRGLRYDRALKMLMDANPLVSEELAANGFASTLYEGDKWEALNRFTEPLNAIQPEVLKAYKQIELRKWQTLNVRQQVMDEIATCAKLWEDDAHHDAVNQFLSKSKRIRWN